MLVSQPKLDTTMTSTNCRRRLDSASSQAGVFKLFEDAEDECGDLEAQQHGDSELHLGGGSQKRQRAVPADGGFQKQREGDWQIGAAAVEAAESNSGAAPAASHSGGSTQGQSTRMAAAAAAAVPVEAPAALGAWQQVSFGVSCPPNRQEKRASGVFGPRGA